MNLLPLGKEERLRAGTHPRKSPATPDRRVEKMYTMALGRLDDLEQAIVSLAEADAAELDRVTGDYSWPLR